MLKFLLKKDASERLHIQGRHSLNSDEASVKKVREQYNEWVVASCSKQDYIPLVGDIVGALVQNYKIYTVYSMFLMPDKWKAANVTPRLKTSLEN